MSGDRKHEDAVELKLLETARADPASEAGRRAASALLARYHGRVYAWCRRYAEDHEQAVELAQDVMLRAFRNLEGYREQARFGTWIFVITRNTCLNAVAKPSLLRDEDAEPDGLHSREPDPETRLIDAQDEERLLDLIRLYLDPLEQRALWLRCFERMSVVAITRVLRIEQESGARAVLQSGRRKLRRALAERDPADARRRHAEACPRCASLLASLLAFDAPDDPPVDGEVADAAARMDAALRREIWKADPAAPASSRSPLPRLFSPRWRNGLALAAILLVLVGVGRVVNRAPDPGPAVLRGDATGEALSLGEVLPVGEDSLRFVWDPHGEATEYRLIVYDADLAELVGFAAGGDSALALPRAAIAGLGGGRAILFWGVSALRLREEVGRSKLKRLTVPD